MALPRPLMGSPQPLLKIEKNGKITWEESTKNMLLKLDYAVESFGIIGPARSGKSYAANKFMGLSDKTKCFEVKPAGEVITKGIWVYCEEHPDRNGVVRMFLDTEGLQHASSTSTSETDLRIIFITVFLCGVVIVNMKDRVNRSIMELLNVTMKCIKFIKSSGQDCQRGIDLGCITPQAIYLLFRDSSDEDEDVRQEMERSLRVHQLQDDFTRCFGRHEERAIPFPSLDREVVRNLLQADDNTLNPEFVQKLAAVSEEIFQNSRIKHIPCQEGGRDATAKDLISIGVQMIDLVNENSSFFQLPALYQIIFDRNVKQAVKRAETGYLNAMKTQLQAEPLPETELRKHHEDAVKESRAIFQREADPFLLHEHRNELADLVERLEEHYRTYQNSNLRKSKEKCEMICQKYFKCIYDNSPRYLKDDGKLEAILEETKEKYVGAVGKLPCAKEVLNEENNKLREHILKQLSQNKQTAQQSVDKVEYFRKIIETFMLTISVALDVKREFCPRPSDSTLAVFSSEIFPPLRLRAEHVGLDFLVGGKANQYQYNS